MRIQITLTMAALLAMPGSVWGSLIRPAFIPDDTVTVRRDGWLHRGSSWTVRYNDPAQGKSKTRTGVGGIQFHNLYGTGDGQLIPLGAVGTFCIDLRDPLSPARLPGGKASQYEVKNLDEVPNGRPMSQDKQTLLRRLFGSFFDPIDPQANVPPPLGFTKKQLTEAFSLAVWEIVYEKPGKETNVTNGDWFRATASTKDKKKVAAKSNEWLAAIQNSKAREGVVWALIPLDPSGTGQFQDRYQDLVIGYVPEPATAVSLIGLGAMLGLALVRRRWRRASAR